MGKFILKRIALALLIVFIVSIFAFLLMRILPGNPVVIALGESAPEEKIREYEDKYHLNEPLLKQYALWIGGCLKGNFGQSILYGEDITVLIKTKLPVTVSIGIPVMIISAVLGVLIGIVTAVKRGSLVDQGLTLLANVAVGVPNFWIAILLIYFFGLITKLLPIQGYVAPSENFHELVRCAILPVTCMSFGFVATIARQTRSSMLEIINQDYIRTARANGLSSGKVIFGHAMKNAMIPVITIIGLQVRVIVGGSVVIEKIFNIPGIGNLLMRAVSERDYFIVQACVLIICIVTVGCNLIVDLLYGLLDPRVRKDWR